MVIYVPFRDVGLIACAMRYDYGLDTFLRELFKKRSPVSKG